MDNLFIGSAICGIEEDGSMLLPEAFRDTIRARMATNELFIGLHEDSCCLIVYDNIVATQHFRDVEARRASCVGSSLEAHHIRLRRRFGFAVRTALGRDGAIAVAPLMCERSGIGPRALVVGTGQYFEIWDLDYALERGPCDVSALGKLHLKFQSTNGDLHDRSMPSSGPRSRTIGTAKPGIRIQPVQSVRPRHDPVDGEFDKGMEACAGGLPG